MSGSPGKNNRLLKWHDLSLIKDLEASCTVHGIKFDKTTNYDLEKNKQSQFFLIFGKNKKKMRRVDIDGPFP